MTSFWSGEWGLPARWPYSWIITVQNFDQSNEALGLKVTLQSPFWVGLS